MSGIDLAELDFDESSADAINGVWLPLEDTTMEFHVRPINDRLRAWTVFTIDCRGAVRVKEPDPPPGMGLSGPDYVAYQKAVERYDAAVGEADKQFTRNMYDRLHLLLACDVVMGWRGVRMKDGTAIDYDVDTARRLFSEHPRLAQRVFDAARTAGGEDQVEFKEAGEKKADAPDGGSSGVNTPKTSNASGAPVAALAH